MKIGFIIIGRLKSTRLKRKVLLDLGGKPVIARMIDRIRRSQSIHEVILATSTHVQDDDLASFSKSYGVSCYRGDENDVLDRIYQAALHHQLDYIVHVTADCPLVDPDYIDKIVKHFQSTNADLITAFDLPHGTFSYGIKVSALGKVLDIKTSTDTEVWGKYFYDLNCFNVSALPVEQSHRRKIRLTLDYQEDYELLQKVFEHLGLNDNHFDLDEIIQLFDQNPAITKINQHCDELYQQRSSTQSCIHVKNQFKIKNALIIGCGSIGRRHIANLRALGVNEIYALRTLKGATKTLQDDLKINTLSSWDEVKDNQFDIAIISNPSSLHLATMQQVIDKVKGVFIEKPISHTLEGIDDMVQIIASKKPVTFVGYNLQFHPIVKKIKEVILSGELGAPIALQAFVGQWLPNWHPDEDWKSFYVAKAKLGGGALLSLIHEVEMAISWLGEAIDVKAYFPESEKLNIDVDVAANLMLSHHSGAVSQLHFDVLQDPTGRGGVVLFEEGRLQYDFIQNEIILISKDHPKGISLYKDESYDTNKCYEEMMQQFLNVVAQRRYRHEHDFVNGVSSLTVAVEALSQRFSKEKKVQYV